MSLEKFFKTLQVPQYIKQPYSQAIKYLTS